MARLLPLASSMLFAIRYNRATGRLFAQFGEDIFYAYDNVPAGVVLDILDAESHGQAFDRLVKKGGFRYQRVSRERVLSD